MYHVARRKTQRNRSGKPQHQLQRIHRGKIVARYQYTDATYSRLRAVQFVLTTLLEFSK